MRCQHSAATPHSPGKRLPRIKTRRHHCIFTYGIHRAAGPGPAFPITDAFAPWRNRNNTKGAPYLACFCGIWEDGGEWRVTRSYAHPRTGHAIGRYFGGRLEDWRSPDLFAALEALRPRH
jgi:hypothetical protein